MDMLQKAFHGLIYDIQFRKKEVEDDISKYERKNIFTILTIDHIKAYQYLAQRVMDDNIHLADEYDVDFLNMIFEEIE